MPAPSRRVVRLSLVALVLAVTAATAWPHSTSSRHATTTSYDAYGLRGHPSPAQQRDAVSAYRRYRTFVISAAQAFTADSAGLCHAGLSGNINDARRFWRAAQMDYDRLRARISDRSSTELTIDGLLATQPVTVGRQGLHAIEEDLFGSTRSQLAADCEVLSRDGLGLTFGLSHTVATPSRIALDANSLLTWMVQRVIAQPQEVVARTQATDTDAVVHAVAAWWTYDRPLIMSLDPSFAPTMDSAIAQLELDQAAIGGPDTPDAMVAPRQWSRLAQDSVHVASLFTRVASKLYGFGAGRTYA